MRRRRHRSQNNRVLFLNRKRPVMPPAAPAIEMDGGHETQATVEPAPDATQTGTADIDTGVLE